MLIDRGNSNNFLQPRVAKFLKLPIQPPTVFKVMVGNGNYMNAKGLIQNLTIQAQGNYFIFPAYLLPISEANLILGASWLKTIGPHLANYVVLQLKFLRKSKMAILQGEQDTLPTPAHLNHIRRLVTTNSIDEVYSILLVD